MLDFYLLQLERWFKKSNLVVRTNPLNGKQSQDVQNGRKETNFAKNNKFQLKASDSI